MQILLDVAALAKNAWVGIPGVVKDKLGLASVGKGVTVRALALGGLITGDKNLIGHTKVAICPILTGVNDTSNGRSNLDAVAEDPGQHGLPN
jgi:hypothetical protein